MGDLSPHFSLDEFACPHCGKADPDPDLINVLEDVREAFGRAVVVTSGYRCPEHNAAVGGAKHSRHLTNEAADIVVAGASTKAVGDYLESQYPDRYGLGVAHKFVHIDVRPKRARWGY